jgi:hypothetical protein
VVIGVFSHSGVNRGQLKGLFAGRKTRQTPTNILFLPPGDGRCAQSPRQPNGNHGRWMLAAEVQNSSRRPRVPPSVGFSEQLARHLEIMQGMTGRPVGIAPKQLEDREIGSSLNQKQPLLLRHAACLPQWRAPTIDHPVGNCDGSCFTRTSWSLVMSATNRRNGFPPTSTPKSTGATRP